MTGALRRGISKSESRSANTTAGCVEGAQIDAPVSGRFPRLAPMRDVWAKSQFSRRSPVDLFAVSCTCAHLGCVAVRRPVCARVSRILGCLLPPQCRPGADTVRQVPAGAGSMTRLRPVHRTGRSWPSSGVRAASASAVNWLDASVMGWVDAHRFPVGDHLARAALAAGTSTAVVAAIAFAVLAYVVLARRYALGVVVVGATVVAAVACGLLKDLFGRARPPASLALAGAAGLSMPSTDAALSAAAAAALLVALGWYRPRRRPLVGSLLAAGVFAVGACLVYLGVHWLTDVRAGWALGATVGCGTAAVVAAVSGRRGPVRPA
jgi:membrane-associated phospholipid phosphatase